MSSPHIPRHGLHCIGFSAQESVALESFFKIAGQRPPGWWVTPDIRDAAIVLLNAHSSEAVEDCQGMMTSWQKLVIVGSSDFGSGGYFVPRPIKLMAILGKINQVLVERTVEVASDTVHASLDLTAARPVSIETAPSFSSPKSVSVPAITAAPAQAASRVLVVDDSDVALKFMQNRLQQLGYIGQLARSGEEALALVAQTSYKFVFMDVMMSGLDGYQTCRAIKQNKSHHGEAPRVIMLTSRGGTIDKLRGSMAGCDGYLTKPLNERQLASVLLKFDPFADALGKSQAQDSVPAQRSRDSGIRGF